MQLIVKTTTRCNFDCTFCSADKISVGTNINIEVLKNFISKYAVDSFNELIFEGGEPLLISPEKYLSLFDWIEHNNININQYGFTTNLWDFYKRPDKWSDIFRRDDVSVCTSFQYGSARRITKNVIYTESMFVDVYNKFKQLVGKDLPFIAVIDDNNKHTAIQTVKLAQQLNTTCKINPLFIAGKSDNCFRWPDMLNIYADIIENGLTDWEENSKLVYNLVTNHYAEKSCPFIHHCNDGFAVITTDGLVSRCSIDIQTHQKQNIIHFVGRDRVSDITRVNQYKIVKPDCLMCRCFDWCNTCKVKIYEAQQLADQSYCDLMCDAVDRLQDVCRKVNTDSQSNTSK